jgi:hypothetical protein
MKMIHLILISSFLFTFNVFAKKAALLSGYDLLALPGEVIKIEVKAEKAKVFPFRSDIKKQSIQYFLKGNFIGDATTNRDGLSKLHYYFNHPGLYTVKASLAAKSKYKASATDNRILVADANQPILITDIDHTIADISGLDFLRTSDDLIPELPEASSTLNKLKSQFLIVYLTARDDTFIKRSKYWLDFMNFPKGPSFFWDFGFWNNIPRSHGKYKEAQIRKLKAKHKKILIGVGDKPHDIVAYLNNGLRAYYIGPSGMALPKNTIIVKSWTVLAKHLENNPIGSLLGDPKI